MASAICDLKIDISCEASVNLQHAAQNSTPATECACCNHLTQPMTMRLATNTQHDTSEALRLPCEMTMEVSEVLPLLRKMRLIFWKQRKRLRLPHKTTFDAWNVTKCHATTRNEATRHLKPPKATVFAEPAIGTAIRPSRRHFRTVANGRERLRTVANGCGSKRKVERTPSTPSPREWNGNPCYAFGKNGSELELVYTVLCT